MQHGTDMPNNSRAGAILRPFLPYCLIMVSGVFWGLNTGIAKLAVNEGVTGAQIAFVQASVVFVGLAMLGAICNERIAFSRSLLVGSILAGIFGLGIPNMIAFFGVDYVSIGVISIIFALVPIFTLVLSLVAKTDRSSTIRVVGILLGLASVSAIIWGSSRFSDRINDTFWVLLMLVSALGYAFRNIVFSKLATVATAPFYTSSATFFFVSITAGVTALLLNDPWTVLMSNPKAMTYTMWMGVAMCIGMAAYVYTIRNFGPVVSSLPTYIVAFTGVVSGVVMFDERLPIVFWGALPFLCLSLYLVNLKPKQSI
ncbi:MAG: DMT family transporter [Sulfitobacter sp.]